MVKEISVGGRKIYACEICGFGYKDKKMAGQCQKWCSKNSSCNLQITKNAVYFPKIGGKRL